MKNSESVRVTKMSESERQAKLSVIQKRRHEIGEQRRKLVQELAEMHEAEKGHYAALLDYPLSHAITLAILSEVSAIEKRREEQHAQIDSAAQVDAYGYGSRSAALLMAEAAHRTVDDQAESMLNTIMVLYLTRRREERERERTRGRERERDR